MTQPFRWPGCVVLDELEFDHEYQVHVVLVEAAQRCPHCGHEQLAGFGRRDEIIRDIPHRGKPCRIILSRRRYRCKACRRAFLEPVPHKAVGRQMTQRLVRYIERESTRRGYSSIARSVGVNEKTIRTALNL